MKSKRKITKQDDYMSRVAKLVPYEIMALYLAIAGALHGQFPGKEKWILTIAGAFCLIATPVYLRYVERVQSTPTINATLQIIISTGSFAVWLYAMKGPFEAWGIYDGQIAAILLIVWITGTGWLSKKK